ncbi:hypothetical protein BX600DRAFT_234367 [Xylariales sp. PMI_506]|nr:hypothetical protein BX600DRAFT_234367 [Xylariales sp. PMI_506]
MTTLKGSVLVTGANGGLGTAIVSRVVSNSLLAKNYHGLYTVRNPERANAVRKALHHVDHKYDIVPLDLSTLAGVRKAAAEINRRVAQGEIPRLRALILNAGWQEYNTQTHSDDGFDLAFQSNYLGHFLLTLLLLQSMDTESGRIVVLGSWSHNTADPRNNTGPVGKAYRPAEYREIFTVDPWNGEDIAKGHWSTAEQHPNDINAGYRRYGASKLCEIMFMCELARRLSSDPNLSQIRVCGVEPGAMATGLGAHGSPVIQVIFKVVLPIFGPIASALQPNGTVRMASKSAADVVRAALEEGGGGGWESGTYFDGDQIASVGPEAKDGGKCGRLWRESVGWAGLQDGDTVLAQV